MAISHLLEDFSVADPSDGASKLMSEGALEDQRLASFEQGYSAGWEDAVNAQVEDHSRVTGVLGRKLEDLSFTYHEAMAQMMGSVEPVFRSLVESVLPDILAQTFSQHIVEQLCEMARDRAAQPVTLVVPAGASAALKPALARNFSMPVEIVEDTTLDPGQASMRIGSAERELDSAHFVDSLRKTVDSFLYQLTEDTHYG
ncbi:MAG: flagellar biosynthesis/type III secretory pathway protein FliH [Paracoccaceae bacterium]|jgi:flagellar biosynthesis/type III secretory pathway protein FliH